MFCHNCGTRIIDGMSFCHQCGTKVDDESVPPQTGEPTPVADGGTGQGDPAIQKTVETSGPGPAGEAAAPESPPAEHGPSGFQGWWKRCSKVKKVLFVLAAVVVGVIALCLLVAFLREFGYLIFGILVLLGFLITIFTGTKEERADARKTLLQLTGTIVAIVVIVFLVAKNFDSVADIVQPGAGVRNAYLTQYSDKVTIERAFDNFFANGKWDTYKANGYSYVTFTGTCEYLDEPADARITFQITGENFVVDRLDINGREQNDLMLAVLLEKVYEDYN